MSSSAEEHTGPIPLAIIRAVQEGDKDLVEQWLVDTEAAYVNATLPEMLQVGRWLLEGGTVTLLTLCIVCNGAYTGRREMPHWGHELQMIAIADYDFQMLAIARMLLELSLIHISEPTRPY